MLKLAERLTDVYVWQHDVLRSEEPQINVLREGRREAAGDYVVDVPQARLMSLPIVVEHLGT